MMNKLKEKLFTKEFLTFGMIGVGNTLISQSLYMVFVTYDLLVGISSLLADAISMVFSYFMNMRFTYRQKPTWKSAITFPLSYLPGMLITALIVVVVVNWANAPKIYAKLISLPITIPLNYLCMNRIVAKFGGAKLNKK